MITLLAKRIGTGVNLYDKENNLKAIFPRRGYRPTKATKEVMVNCWKCELPTHARGDGMGFRSQHFD
jgi:hypothetical protein